MTPDSEKEFPLKTPEAARILGVTPATLLIWAKKGQVRHGMTPGGHKRFPRAEIERIAREMAGV